MRDVCDAAYARHVEQLEQKVLAERQIWATFQASGRYESSEPPTLAVERKAFEERLHAALFVTASAESHGLSLEEFEMRQALGVFK